ncbi:MAG TPA: hypothetical protein VLF60_02905 [Candidatus Saccharimonadales bacterium]|nr:hypothetical protein [Candidatus Saccharimonadales bacterium]
MRSLAVHTKAIVEFRTRLPRMRIAAACFYVMVVATIASMLTGDIAQAGTGGRFTFLRDDGSYWGVTFAGAGYGEIPFAIDTNGDGKQELAVYYNGRMTIRKDDGSYWGFNFIGGGYGEVPLAMNFRGHGDRRQQFVVYYHGRFTWLNDDGSYGGVTFPGAGSQELPLAVDTDGDGVQEFGVYKAGRFTFMRADGSLWGVTFAGATANDLPFVIDTNGDGRQELAVYRNGRMTIRRDDGSYWGFDYQGAGLDEYPMAIDTDGNGRQEFTVYSHVPVQTLAKQILANPTIDKSARAVTEDLEQTADGQPAVNYLGQNYSLSSALLRPLIHFSYTHTMAISALTGNGTGHTNGSQHYYGDAFDLNWIDGHNPLTGRDKWSMSAIDSMKYDLPSGSRFGQLYCPGGTASLPSGITEFSQDACNHLHVDVPRGTN